jgi:inner membrane protein
MDNLAHSLVGLTAAKAGLGRVSPFATTLCILAANSPDADVAVGFFADRWTLLKHHRGITHSIVGTLTLAIVLPVLFYLIERAISHFLKRQSKIRLRGLLIASLITTATHPLLDWTNNYGVRPFMPVNSRWLYGDLTFVVDPYLWLILGGAAFLLTSNRRIKIAGWVLVGLGIMTLMFFAGGQRAAGGASLWPVRLIWISGALLFVLARVLNLGSRFGERIALAAFAVVVLYCGGLAIAHYFAFKSAIIQAESVVTPLNEKAIKAAAMPTLGNPRRWLCVVETERAVYRFTVKLGGLKPFDPSPWPDADPYRMPNSPNFERFPKPTGAAAELVDKAEQDRRAQILLDFARFPIATVADTNCLTQTLVQFADVRYTQPGAARGSFALDVPVDCPMETSKQ